MDQFFAEGFHQWQWRKTYNEIMDLFRPLMEELKKVLPTNDELLKEYSYLGLKDDQYKIIKTDGQRPDVFNLKSV